MSGMTSLIECFSTGHKTGWLFLRSNLILGIHHQFHLNLKSKMSSNRGTNWFTLLQDLVIFLEKLIRIFSQMLNMSIEEKMMSMKKQNFPLLREHAKNIFQSTKLLNFHPLMIQRLFLTRLHYLLILWTLLIIPLLEITIRCILKWKLMLNWTKMMMKKKLIRR
jgi:hypothetical protein